MTFQREKMKFKKVNINQEEELESDFQSVSSVERFINLGFN